MPSLIILCGLALFCFYQFCYPYHFYYQEQNQLFLQTGEYIRQYFQQPAWLACLVGDWLTQFYYYRLAGPAILSLTLTLMGFATWQSLCMAGLKRASCCIAIIVMLIFAAFTLHYTYRLSQVLAALGGVLLFCCVIPLARLTNNKIITCVILLLALPLGFFLFGNGWNLYAILLIIYGICHNHKSIIITLASVAIMYVVIIPLTKHVYWLDVTALYAYPGYGKIVKPEFEFDRDLGIETEYRLGNWNKVISNVEKTENPTLGEVFFYNLVQAQRGNLPNVLTKYSNNYLGTFETIGPTTPLLTIKRINELYWALGDMTFTERAALQALVFSPGNRNVGMIKRLAEVNIVSGDTKAADKYLRLLEKTAVYGRWAGNAMHNPVYQKKALMTNKKDTLRTSDNTHLIMMELLDSNPSNMVALDYMLCSDLLQKDIGNFKRDYDRYCLKSGNRQSTALYQEALMIWLAGTNAKEDEWHKYIRRPDLLEKFAQYNQMRGNAQFSDTYWYWFDTHK